MTLATLLVSVAIASTCAAAPGSTTASDPVILDFTAGWCGPCREMRPAVDRLLAKGYPIRAVDIEAEPETARKYKVERVPTFLIVDASGRELSRTEGLQPAARLAAAYNAVLKAQDDRNGDDAPAPAEAAGKSALARELDEGPAGGDDPSLSPPANPRPWETAVRIKVIGGGMLGFGSGTIISSTPDEALILTCAHIFKMDGQRPVPPSQFPREIVVDLFDGRLKGARGQTGTVHYAGESYKGKAVDYDFSHDVGLIRIKTGRRLPASRVVPADWSPRKGMPMVAVGCPEGHDATAWDTQILNPKLKGLSGSPDYEAIECDNAPIQGRSGGGLYTSDGYVAGVCDFAETSGNRGLYATPRSIHNLLDRNKLATLYRRPAPGTGGTLLAKNTAAPAPRREPPIKARAQSDDREDALSVPPPAILGVEAPVALAENGPGRPDRRRVNWGGPGLRTTDAQSDKAAAARPTILPDEAPQANLEDVPPPANAPVDPRVSGWKPGVASSRLRPAR